MANALDVARYILKRLGPVTAMKLQKLVYYSQAWSLVWDEEPLFTEKIRAWANGPVVPSLFRVNKGQFKVSSVPGGDIRKLSKEQKETVDAVIDYYGDRAPQWLSDLTHMEAPWRDARKGLPEGERGDREITLVSMADYYESLQPDS